MSPTCANGSADHQRHEQQQQRERDRHRRVRRLEAASDRCSAARATIRTATITGAAISSHTPRAPATHSHRQHQAAERLADQRAECDRCEGASSLVEIARRIRTPGRMKMSL